MWKLGIYTSNEVRKRSLDWVLTQYHWCLHKKKLLGHRDRHRGRAVWGPREQTGMWRLESHCPTKDTAGLEEAGRSKEGSFVDFRRSTTLPTPWFQTSSLQHCDTIHFCCLKPPCPWYFFKSTLGNEYNTSTRYDTWHQPSVSPGGSSLSYLLEFSCQINHPSIHPIISSSDKWLV